MRVWIELGFLALGLAVALGLTWGCAWAYPLGRYDIWLCGVVAMAASIAASIGPIRRAIAADRTAR